MFPSKAPKFDLSDEDTNELDLKQILEQYFYYWKWFVISVCIALIAAVIYLRYSTPQYKVDAKILLEKEDKASGELSGLAELNSLTGGSGQSAFVLDQIDVIRSRRLLRKVIEKNNLQNTYYIKGNIKESEVLEAESPVKVIIQRQDLSKKSGSIAIKILDRQWISVKDHNGERLDKIAFGQPFKTSFGEVIVVPNKILNNDLINSIRVSIHPVDVAIDNMQKSLSISPNTEKQSYIVNFSLTGALIEKSKLIINDLIEQYNKDVTDDKNKITLATSSFINSRLTLIGNDMESVDKKVQDFKSSNNMTDLMAEAELNLQTLTQADRDVLERRTQLQLVDYMRESIGNNEDLQLLPTNIGLEDQSIEKTIVEYNKLVLERDDLLKSSTAENPVVKNISENIRSLNRNLNTSLNNYRSVLQLSLNNSENKRNQIQGRVSAVPRQELGFKDIARQQKIVESMYLFLLEKREENEIKASAQPDILKIIDSAYGSPIPVAPKKSIILLGALIAGLLLPFAVLYIKFLLDNKVQSRKDVEAVFPAPILGEVPSSDDPIIKDNDRSSLAEAIRILRTNISFMLTKKKGESAVIYVTSTTSGEGKSFIATNLAKILAMSDKKVLLLGADIRSPKVLDYLGLSHLQHTNVGITQYLINPDMPISEIIISKPAPYDFDIIYSGYIAPNPAELLMNGHFSDIVAYGRENYDYVIVDTAPVSLVTDTILISEFADLTIYVARANYLDKRLLNVPKELYYQGKLNNMAVVLNDVDFKRGYGYGYGYGYGDHMKTKTPWGKLKSLFTRK